MKNIHIMTRTYPNGRLCGYHDREIVQIAVDDSNRDAQTLEYEGTKYFLDRVNTFGEPVFVDNTNDNLPRF